MITKTDVQFVRKARRLSTRSRDPNRQVGAIIAGGGTIIGRGFNQFPPGIRATKERLRGPTKNKYMVHAEIVALASVPDNALGFFRSTIYVYGAPVCDDCAKHLLLHGHIGRVVAPCPLDPSSKWTLLGERAIEMFREAKVALDLYDPKDLGFVPNIIPRAPAQLDLFGSGYCPAIG